LLSTKILRNKTENCQFSEGKNLGPVQQIYLQAHLFLQLNLSHFSKIIKQAHKQIKRSAMNLQASHTNLQAGKLWLTSHLLCYKYDGNSFFSSDEKSQFFQVKKSVDNTNMQLTSKQEEGGSGRKSGRVGLNLWLPVSATVKNVEKK
jgi:hypothetical protein